MPPKKIGLSSRRSSISSFSRRRQPQMSGYKEGLRIMDKSFKITLSLLSGLPSNYSKKRKSKPIYIYNVNSCISYLENSEKSIIGQIWALLLITIETILFNIIFICIFYDFFAVAILLLILFSLFLPLLFLSLDINTF